MYGDGMLMESEFYRRIDWGGVELNDRTTQWSLSDREYRTLVEAQFLIDNRKYSLRQMERELGTGVRHHQICRDLHSVLPTLSIVMYDECMAILKSHREWKYCYGRKMEEKARKR